MRDPGWISAAVKADVHAKIKKMAARQDTSMNVIIAKAIALYTESGMEALDARNVEMRERTALR